jgi:hypothetical protein
MHEETSDERPKGDKRGEVGRAKTARGKVKFVRK